MEHQFHYGKKFYLDREMGYWISTVYPRIRAHVFVWEYHHGNRPDGFHVHHKDQDKSNNSIENLELIEGAEHLRQHMTPERREQARKRMPMMQELAKGWHGTEEGRAWHRKHVNCSLAKVWATEYPGVCACCKKDYVGETARQRFCSNNCKSEWRRREGLDSIEIQCPVCGEKFTKNKYARAVTCGRKCGGIFRKGKKHSR